MHKGSITFGTQQKVHVRTVEYFLETIRFYTVNGVTVILTLLLLEDLCQYWVYETLHNITLCLYSVNILVKLRGSVCLIAVATYNFSKLVWAHEPLSVL